MTCIKLRKCNFVVNAKSKRNCILKGLPRAHLVSAVVTLAKADVASFFKHCDLLIDNFFGLTDLQVTNGLID